MRPVFVLSLTLFLNLPTQAAETLLWYMPNFEPGHFDAGPMAGLGYVDLTLERVIEPAMPGFEHKVVVAPITRMLHDMQEKPNVCTVAIQVTAERKKLFLFSRPAFRYQPVGLIVRTDDLPALAGLIDEGSQISLARYEALESTMIGLVADRAYGDRLDPMLAESEHTLRIVGSNATSSLPKMLLAGGRITAFLGYSFEIGYAGQQNGDIQTKLTWLPVKEQPAVMQSHMACSRSPLGERVIERLNTILSQAEARQQIQSYYESWLPPAMRERLRRSHPTAD
jgi:uncharacterized protein (TIGR02285 family)